MSILSRDPRLLLVAVTSSATAIALALTGEVSVVGMAVPAVAAWAVLKPRREPRGRAFEWSFQLVALVALGWFVLSLQAGRVLGGAAVLTFPVQVHAFLQPPGLKPLRRLQTIGFFQLVALAASTTAIFFGPLVLLHLALAPALHVLQGLESAEGEPRRPLSLPRPLLRSCMLAAAAVAVIGVPVFLALPRYEVGLGSRMRGAGQRMSGFSESVTLGDITRIQSSDEIVMRVKLRGEVPADLRWRGIALDRFTGRGWESGASPGRPQIAGETYRIAEAPPGSRRVVQEMRVEPSAVRALFHLPGATQVIPQNFRGVRVDEWGNLQRSGEPVRRARYEVVSEPGPRPEPLGDQERAAFLQLPPGLDPRIAATAAEIAGQGSDGERAQRLSRWLQGTFEYGLDVDDTGAADPVAWFLFEKKRGHCEYFATSLAVMLRTAGIPSRVVNGFQEGEYSRLFGAYIVRQRDAHSWVEAFLPGLGWTTFDPTPAAPPSAAPLGDAAEIWRQVQILWDDNVIGFNYTFQLGFLTTVGEWWTAGKAWLSRSGALVLAVAAAALLACGAAVTILLMRRNRRRGSSRRRVAFYDRAQRLLARRGHRRRASQTPWELAREAGAKEPAIAEPALEITRLYYAARFGGVQPDPARIEELLRKLAA